MAVAFAGEINWFALFLCLFCLVFYSYEYASLKKNNLEFVEVEDVNATEDVEIREEEKKPVKEQKSPFVCLLLLALALAVGGFAFAIGIAELTKQGRGACFFAEMHRLDVKVDCSLTFFFASVLLLFSFVLMLYTISLRDNVFIFNTAIAYIAIYFTILMMYHGDSRFGFDHLWIIISILLLIGCTPILTFSLLKQ